MDALARSGDWVRGTELASWVGISPRSVRNYVASINKAAQSEVIQSGLLGYRLADPTQAHTSLGLDEAPVTRRRRRIAAALAQSSAPMNSYELADSLYVSESTVEQDLAALRTQLEGTGMRLVRVHDDVKLEGEEATRRHFVASLLRAEASDNFDILAVLSTEYPALPIVAFATDLDALLTRLGFDINDHGFNSAIVHIVVIATGLAGRLPPAGHDVENPAVDTLARGLESLIATHFGAQPDRAEVEEMMAQLTLKAVNRPAVTQDRDDEVSAHIMERAIEELRSEQDLDLSDPESIERMRRHIAALLRRLKAGTSIANPWGESLRTTYPLIYELAVSLARTVEEETGLRVPTDEIGFLSLHLGAALQDQVDEEERVTATLVAPRYQGFADRIAERLTAALAEDLTIVSVTHILPVRLETDLLLATRPLPGAVLINPLVAPDDIDRVRQAVQQVRKVRRAETIAPQLLRLFDRRHFLHVDTFATPEEAIRTLGRLLERTGIFTAGDTQSVLDREELASTSFLGGLAMPHTMTMNAARTAFAVAVLDHPMTWEPNTVSLVILLATSRGDTQVFRTVMKEFTALLLEPHTITELTRVGVDFDSFVLALLRGLARH